MRTRSPTGYGYVAAIVAAVSAAPLAAVLAAGRTVAWKDTSALFAPVRAEIARALRDGRLPLWNSHEALGMPLFAQLLHGVLHPVPLAFALAAPGAPIDLVAAVHVALAAAGAALLARGVGAGRPGAAAAGLAFGLSGYTLGMTGNLMYLAGAGTAPWALEGLRRAGAGPGWSLPAAAAATAALWLAGDPQWAIASAALGLALAADAGGLRGLLRAGAALCAGTALAAVQLVPTAAFLGETVRGAGLGAADRAQWALAPARLVELIAPGFFSGSPGAELVSPVFQALGGAGQRFTIPFATSVHVGAAALLLAVLGARAGRRGAALAAGALLALWLALGPALGGDALAGLLPVWRDFRYPEKLVGPFTLGVALLAGLGAERAREPGRAAPMWAGAGALAAALAAAAARHAPLDATPWDRFALDEAAAAAARGRLSAGLVHAAVALAAVALILAAVRRGRLAGARAPILLAVVVATQGLAASPAALRAGEPPSREPSPLAGMARDGDLARVLHPVPVPRGLGPPGLDETARLERLERRMAYPAHNVAAGLDAWGAYTGLLPRRYMELRGALTGNLGEEGRWIAPRRFGVGLVAVPGAVEPDVVGQAAAAVVGGAELPLSADAGFRLFAVPHRPFAYFARTVTPAASLDLARRALIRSLQADGEDVVVEGAAAGPRHPGRVLGVTREAERVEVFAESDGPALLVVNDAWWPGWVARLDGREVPILRADALVRAVEWPAGRHRLELRYEPPELRTGLLVSAAGVAALAALIALAAARRRTRTARASGGA